MKKMLDRYEVKLVILNYKDGAESIIADYKLCWLRDTFDVRPYRASSVVCGYPSVNVCVMSNWSYWSNSLVCHILTSAPYDQDDLMTLLTDISCTLFYIIGESRECVWKTIQLTRDIAHSGGFTRINESFSITP